MCFTEGENLERFRIRQDRYWKTIIDTMVEALMVVDSQGLIIAVNKSMLKLTDFEEDELIEKPCDILKCDKCFVKKNKHTDRFCALFEKNKLQTRCTMQKKDGTRIDVFKKAAVLKNEAGKIIGGVETFTDLSEAMAKEKIISNLRNELSAKDGFQSMIGTSPGIKKVFELIKIMAKADTPVIIYGESGTGKELVANAIHRLSYRVKSPFVKVNCAALNESILESELFGHVKGAFTGAFKTRVGRFEAADKGDIFLDEIGDMPLSTQVKLLRVIEDKIIEKVGDNDPVPLDVRIISATHKNLEELIEQGKFREDLFYRIGVLPIHIPPLRERKEDIPLLVNAFINKIRLKTGKQISTINKNAMDILYTYNWPGNIRELINVIEYAFVLCSSDEIRPAHLPLNLIDKGNSGIVPVSKENFIKAVKKKNRCQDSELKKKLLAILSSTGGNKSKAAELLGISRVTLYKYMKQFNIHIGRTIYK